VKEVVELQTIAHGKEEGAAYQAFGSGMHARGHHASVKPSGFSSFDPVQLVTATTDCAMSAINAS